MKAKSFIKDFLYSTFGIVLYNAIIQFIVNPYLNKELGNEYFGIILSVLSIISLFATSFGVGCNNSRMLAQVNHEEIKDDFIFLIFKVCFLSTIVMYSILFLTFNGKLRYNMLTVLLCIATILRYYLDVKYRIDLNYKGYSVYYITIGIGYLLGIVFYRIIGIWQIIYLTGELLAIFIRFIPLKIKKIKKIKKSSYYNEYRKSVIMLSVSGFMTNSILQLDRIILSIVSTGSAVTIFYVATLCGKIISLVAVPLNGVIIGYSIKNEEKICNRKLIFLSGIILGVTFIFAGIGMFFSYIFMPIIYPDVFNLTKPILFIANLGQAFFFSSEVCQTIILKDTKEKIQLQVNSISFIILCVLGTYLTINFDFYGMAYAVLIVTVSKFILINVFGLIYLKNKELKI